MDKKTYRVEQPITVRVGVKSVGKKPGELVELTTHAARSLLSNSKVSQYIPPAATPAATPAAKAEDVESKEEPKEPEGKEESKEPAKKTTSRRRRKAKAKTEGDDD